MEFGRMSLLLSTVVVGSPRCPFDSGKSVILSCKLTINTVLVRYCWYENNRLVPSHIGYSAKPTPYIGSNTVARISIGNRITLTCDMGQQPGWRFYWYRDTQTDPVAQTDGNSYSISSVTVSDGGKYRCRAGRGDPVYYTEYSKKLWVEVKESPKAVLTPVSSPDIFTGQTLSLRCDIQRQTQKDWRYTWYKDGNQIQTVSSKYTVRKTSRHHSGDYSCRGTHRDSLESEISNVAKVTVSECPKPVVSVSSNIWLTEGDYVILSCEVGGSSTGWRFSWYKTAPYRESKSEQVYHEHRRYSVELLSDSIRGSGGSYTLSPAALRHSGVYVCRAERGEPAYHTEFSQPQPLWVTGLSPPSSLVVSPSINQHFTFKSMSLRCNSSGSSTNWRLRWFSSRRELQICPHKWITDGGSACNTSSAYHLETGVYWCQSESGEQSNPVNITVTQSNLILESPAHPVTEGDRLTLRCQYRYQPSIISADFYKDGTLLQTSTTGEMTIPTVSKAHEGLYKCRNPQKGDSPESWIAIKASNSESIKLWTYMVIGLVIIMAMVRLLVWLCCFLKPQGPATQILICGQKSQNTSQNPNMSQPAGNNGVESEYMTMKRGARPVQNINQGGMSQLKNNKSDYEVMASFKARPDVQRSGV